VRGRGIDENSIFLSVLVTGEIRRGIESIRKRDRRAALALKRWLDNVIRLDPFTPTAP
jgi:predicted nucleic acid-binding protein